MGIGVADCSWSSRWPGCASLEKEYLYIFCTKRAHNPPPSKYNPPPRYPFDVARLLT